MAGVEDEDEFRDALDAAADPPHSSPSLTSKPKPAAAAGGGLGRRLLASIPLPATLSAAIGRISNPKPPASNVGLGLLLHPGPTPSADGSPASDASASSSPHLPPMASLQRQHGEDQVAGHGAGVGEELGLVRTEEQGPPTAEGREKESVAVDGRLANRNGFSLGSQEEEGEHCTGVEVGAAVDRSVARDQEVVVVVEQEGSTGYCPAVVEDQSNNAAVEQCASDETRTVKDDHIVEVKETAMEQEGAVDILGAAENGVAVGLQEEEEAVVLAEQGKDGISVQDQHEVVEQCTGHQEVVEQEGAAKYYTAQKAVEPCTNDGSRAVKDGNVVEEKERAVEQEGAVGILDAARDGVCVKSQEEDDVVVAEQGEDNTSVQDQHKVVEQCTSDQLKTTTDDNAAQDQEVVEQEGATKYYTALEPADQCTNDGSRAVKDRNVMEEKERVVEQEGAVAVLDAAKDGITVESQEEKDGVVAVQSEDGISVPDQHKLVEQWIDDQLETTTDNNAVKDQEVVEQEGAIVERGATDGIAVGDQEKKIEQYVGDESKAAKDENAVEDKEEEDQEDVIDKQGAIKDGSGVESQEEEDVVVAGDDISVQDEGNVVEQCPSNQLRATMDDNAAECQELVEQENAIIERGATADGTILEDQDREVEQSAGDESRATKDKNAVEDNEKVVDQEDVIDKQVAIKDGSGVESQAEEEHVVVAEQGGNGISVRDEGNVVEQCTGNQLRTTRDDNAAEDQGVVELEGAVSILGAAKVGTAFESREDLVVAEQVEDGISVQDEDKVVEQCISDELRTIIDDNAAEDQEARREKVQLCAGYPLRTSKLNCRFYMSTGSCVYGSSCHFNHPQLKAKTEVSSFPSEQRNHEVEFLELNCVGFPIREGARNCTYYMRNGTCRYGKKCCFNHPEQVLDVQLHTPTGWDDTNLQSSPHSKKSPEHATVDDTSSNSEFLPPNILRMLLPPQNVPPCTEEKEMKVKKDPDWSSASDDSDGCCSADSSGGPLCKQEQVDYPERHGRQECPFLLRFGNCKFASACQYYHPKDKFPSRYNPKDKLPGIYHPKDRFPSRYRPKKDPSLSEELMVYPDKPGEPECPFYMKTGYCKFGADCKFHHPKDLTPSMQGPATPKRSVAANEHDPAARTMVQDYMYQQPKYPERPGQPDCRYYMQFGKCKFQSACIFNHPRDRLSSGWPRTECPFYMKTGTCQFGSACEFHHPKDRCSSTRGTIDDGDYGHEFSTKSDHVLQQQEHIIYPERPGEPECSHYMKHGCCKFQMSCKYHHPTDRLAKK